MALKNERLRLERAWMKLLLVEDEADLNRGLTKLLKKEHFSVDSAFDGEEALEFLEMVDYDLIILDIMMPRMDGFTEKEYKIDARTGSILKAKEEPIDDNEDMQLTQTNVQLTFEDAEKILQQKYPQAHVYDEELDIWNGQVVYKVEALNGTQKVKITIDVNSGNILNERIK